MEAPCIEVNTCVKEMAKLIPQELNCQCLPSAVHPTKVDSITVFVTRMNIVTSTIVVKMIKYVKKHMNRLL